MKVYHIMMFLLLFNLSISAINGLHIYNIGVTVPEDYNVSNYQAGTSDTLIYRIFGYVFTFVIVAAVSATIFSAFTKTTSDAAVAYGLFSSFFFTTTISALQVMWSIGSMAGPGVLIIIVIFALICGGTFLAGVAQMIRGGWKTYE